MNLAVESKNSMVLGEYIPFFRLYQDFALSLN